MIPSTYGPAEEEDLPIPSGCGRSGKRCSGSWSTQQADTRPRPCRRLNGRMKKIPHHRSFSRLFVLLVAAELYVQSDLFAVKLRPLVIAPLKEVLGERAEIGWVRANLIPMYVEARDIVLPDDQGRPAAAIRKIRISHQPVCRCCSRRSACRRSWCWSRGSMPCGSRDGEINILPRHRPDPMPISSRCIPGPVRVPACCSRTITVNQGRLSFRDEIDGRPGDPLSGCRRPPG